MGRLRVALLGPPDVRVAGRPLRVDTRKAVALLAYLAATGRRHGRDELAALLWPDADDAHARGALRRTLSALNAALNVTTEGASGATGGPTQVAADRAGLELVAPGLELDLARFRQLMAACGTHGHPPERACPACAAPLTEAVGLHRGEFMSGFVLRDAPAFEDWQVEQTASLRRELTGALQKLVEAHALARRWDAAEAAAQRWLALDPLDEAAHRQLMRVYAWSGQRSAAMRQYRACVRVLDQELGVAPLEETTALHHAVVKGQADPPPEPPPVPTEVPAHAAPTSPAPATIEPTAVTAATTGPVRAAPGTPLVGRGAQWAALQKAWAEVAGALAGHLVAVTGEPGIGKTRLVEEFAAHAAAQGGQVLACRCYDGERLAYGPLADALRTALARPDAWARELTPHWRAEAARLLPELAPPGTRPDPPTRPDGPGAQHRFLEGLCHILLAAARGARPGLLVVDDLHWADEATLTAIGYLVRRLDRWPLLVVAAWQPEQAQRGHPLRRLLADARARQTATTLQLARLDQEGVAELVAAVAPGRGGAAAEVYRRTEGLPLLLVAYLEALRDADEGSPLPDLPGGARELFQARLERVSAPAWQLLTAAAVIGRSFDVDIVRDASGRSDEEATAALEELARLGLVQEVAYRSSPARTATSDTAAGLSTVHLPDRNPGPGGRAATTGYDFSHEQVRVLVYEQAGLARRRLLHRRVAQALAARHHDAATQPAVIARHYQLAGQDAEAAEWFARAGQRAAGLYANRVAVAHYQAALALGHPDTARLQLALGDLHTLVGEYPAALAAYEVAAAHHQAAGPPRALAMVEHRLGTLHHRRGDWEAADAHLQAALAALDTDSTGAASSAGADTALRARLVADRSLTAHRRGDAEAARQLAAQALELAEAAGDPAALAHCHNLAGMLATGAGQHQQATDHLQRSLTLASTLADPSMRVAALNNLALAHRAAGRLDPALELTTTALEACAAQGDRHRQAALHNNLADLLHAAGRRDEAMTHLKQAVAIFAEVGEPGHLQPAIWQLVEW